MRLPLQYFHCRHTLKYSSLYLFNDAKVAKLVSYCKVYDSERNIWLKCLLNILKKEAMEIIVLSNTLFSDKNLLTFMLDILIL